MDSVRKHIGSSVKRSRLDLLQFRNTVVAVVEVLGCVHRNNPSQLLKIWFATLQTRVFSQAFRNEFLPVKELGVINLKTF
jgi:hypothetical protein